MKTYSQCLDEISSCDAPLATQLAALPNLEAILRWAPYLTGIDSIQQDEYNYDILIPHRETDWLAFGVT